MGGKQAPRQLVQLSLRQSSQIEVNTPSLLGTLRDMERKEGNPKRYSLIKAVMQNGFFFLIPLALVVTSNPSFSTSSGIVFLSLSSSICEMGSLLPTRLGHRENLHGAVR